jgi:hypothetical protein
MRPVSHEGAFPPCRGKFATPVRYILIEIPWFALGYMDYCSKPLKTTALKAQVFNILKASETANTDRFNIDILFGSK